MKGSLAVLGVVVRVAVGDLLANRVKTFIVGGIVCFGTLLVIVGNSLLDSVISSMSRSVIGSAAEHIQVYNATSKDSLTVLGGLSFGDADLEPFENFERIRASLGAVPNIKSVVPMGLSGAMVTSGNTIDLALERLRAAVRDDHEDAGSTWAASRDHVRQILSVLRRDIDNVRAIRDVKGVEQEEIDTIDRAASAEFWLEFEQDPLTSLEYLENRIAPLAVDADHVFLRYLGTDMQTFAQSFEHMKITDGQLVPPGHRGFMFSRFVYEDQLKLKTARRLDLIKERRETLGVSIDTDDDSRRMIRENIAQISEIQLQLNALQTEEFCRKLRLLLASNEEDLGKLLAGFFAMSDLDFDARYAFFYSELAPSLQLYRVRIGDVLTIRALTRRGETRSVNVPVYGTFEFEGLERSALAGGLNIIDLVSFRDLYGLMTETRLAETKALQAMVGARDVRREDAEEALFGLKPSDEDPRLESTSNGTLNSPELEERDSVLNEPVEREHQAGAQFSPEETQRGAVLNVAVLLHEEGKLEETIRLIEERGRASGLPLKAISWQQASGVIGQFARFAKGLLQGAIWLTFLTAFVIINNSLVMATLGRVRELGTLRAIGAQRSFVGMMLMVEAMFIGVLFGAIGVVAGVFAIRALGSVGIPAMSDEWVFFFSGPRLHPFLGDGSLFIASGTVLILSAASALYPGWLATRITPLQAMAEEE